MKRGPTILAVTVLMLIGCSVLSAQQKSSAAQTVTFAVMRVNSVATVMKSPTSAVQPGLQTSQTNHKVTISFSAQAMEQPLTALTVRQPRSLLTPSNELMRQSVVPLKKARPLITVTD